MALSSDLVSYYSNYLLVFHLVCQSSNNNYVTIKTVNFNNSHFSETS